MYMASGHFNYLEYASSELAFPFTREVANLARMAVTRAEAKARSNKNVEVAGDLTTTGPAIGFQEMTFSPLHDVCSLPYHSLSPIQQINLALLVA